jgi:hypothetical protein
MVKKVGFLQILQTCNSFLYELLINYLQSVSGSGYKALSADPDPTK